MMTEGLVAPAVQPRPSWRQRLPGVLIAAALCFAVTAIYLPTLGHEYVWDDLQYLVDNEIVSHGLTFPGLRWAFTSFYAANWHPLTWLSHMLDAQLFGPGPAGPHLVNILLHAANTLLVLRLFLVLSGSRWRSLLIAAIFAVHPVHVESVAWAAERKDLLAALFGLLALLSYRRYAATPGAARLGGALLLFGAGLMAKPMLVTLPFVLLLLDFWPFDRLRLVGWRRIALEKAPFLILSAAVSAVTVAAQTAEAQFLQLPLADRAANAVVSWVRYVALAAWPAGLAVFYPHPYPQRQWSAWLWAGAALALVAASSSTIGLWRRRPWAAVGWFWFAGMLVPVIGLVQVGRQALADRYLYLPLVGLALLTSWSLAELAERRAALQLPIAAAAAAAVLALGVASSIQVGFWRDPFTLFERALNVTEENAEAHLRVGEQFEKRGAIEKAAAHYRAAVLITPGDATALNNLGVLRSRQGNFREAEALFREAVAVAPTSGIAHANLGRELARRGLAAEAIGHLEAAMQLDPRYPDAPLELAKLLLGSGDAAAAARPLAQAEERYREHLERNPRDADAQLNLGAALAWSGRPAQAAVHFAAAARLQPRWADARGNLGVALEQLGRRREAAEQYREALRIDPSSEEYRRRLSAVEMPAGR